MGGAKRLGILLAVVLVATACGGGDDEEAAPPDCPTTTPGQPTATTTIDPRCVERATERSDTPDESARQTWKGTLSTTEGGPGFFGRTDGTFDMTVAQDGVVTGSGTSHSTYSGAAPINSQIEVSGQRNGSSFGLVIALTPGQRIDVEAPISGTVAEGSIDLTGEAGTFSRGQVRLECQDCGDPGG